MVEPEILAYYERNAERDRLASGARRIEFLRMRDLLARHLPHPPAKILDVGGGAGIYAFPLAADGYEVHLIDPVPLLVRQATEASTAAEAPLASCSAGDARSLEAADSSADAVLLLGPLYHLTSRDDRVTALREAHRVTRPGGVVAALALSRFYPLFEALVGGLGTAPSTPRAARPRSSPTGSTGTPPGTLRGSRRPTSTAPESSPQRLRTRAWYLTRSRVRTGLSSSCCPTSSSA
jgi:SAM-dependent methyltransferase